VQPNVEARKRPSIARVVAMAGLAGMAAFVVGCGSSDEDSSSDTPAPAAETTQAAGSEVKSGLRLAFFQPTNTNEYTVIEVQATKDAAERYGASMDVFNAEYDGAKQASQIQQATTSGKYDGLVIMPAAGFGTICNAIKEALAAGIAVGMTNQPACSAALTQEEYATPLEGTAGFVGLQSPDVYAEWFRRGFEIAGDGGEYAVITGPTLHENTPRQREALDSVKGDFPGWEEVGFVPGDYLPATALQKATTLLRSNPDLKVIFSTYTTMSQAIANAIRAAGKEDQVMVMDSIADKSGVEAVESGAYALTYLAASYEEGYRGVQQVVGKISGLEEVDGIPVGEFYELSEDPKFGGLSPFLVAADIPKYTELGWPESMADKDSLKVVDPQ
jgi:ribose transport system substrate-binding protein